jgi:hypothetical protein
VIDETYFGYGRWDKSIGSLAAGHEKSPSPKSYSNILATNICHAKDTMTISTSLAFSSTYGDPPFDADQHSRTVPSGTFCADRYIDRYIMTQPHKE